MDRFVDFLNSKSDWVMLNPRMSQSERERLENIVQEQALGEHIWLMSSGTESQRGGRLKMVALSKAALLSAAKGVNEFFSVSQKDVIYNSLPQFHVAGLLQNVRAHVSGAQLVQAPELAWDVFVYCKALQTTQTTITSLVPTQIYDLVQAQQKAPPTLRCVFAGGGALSEFLLQQAQTLGWPLVRTYGMTETSAMIACKEAHSQTWRRLPHLQKWESTAEQKIRFFGPSLLTGYLLIDGDMSSNRAQWLDPKLQGWFESDDRGVIQNDELILLGRESEIVKVKGETVSLLEMNERWQRYCQTNSYSPKSVIVPLPHTRDGHELVLVTEECLQIEQIQLFQNELLPYQKIQRVFAKTLIPRTELGKIKTADLIKSLQ